MKNYKLLVPVILVVFFIASVYMLYDTKSGDVEQYNEYLAAAREYRKQDIQVDAESNYMAALEMVDSLELSIEIGEFFKEAMQFERAITWGGIITENYPEEVAGYEFLARVHDLRQDYTACYEVADIVAKRHLQSDVIDEILQRIEYTFFFHGQFEDAGVYSGGLAPIQLKGKWGYVNQSGAKEIYQTYTYAGPFIEDIAPVIDAEGNCYFIDPLGNKKHVVLGVEKIEQLGLMEDGLFPLYDGEKWHFYNIQHEKVFGDFDDVSAIGNAVAAVQVDGKWRLVDRTGADLTGKTYAAVAMDDKGVVYRNERLFVSDGTKYQMITSSGEVIGKESYEDVKIFFDWSSYAAVKVNGKWGFVDADGEMKIPAQYDDARSFSNGMAAVKVDGLWGFIDTEGKMVINPQFQDARDFNASGAVFVQVAEDWQLLRLFKFNH